MHTKRIRSQTESASYWFILGSHVMQRNVLNITYNFLVDHGVQVTGSYSVVT